MKVRFRLGDSVGGGGFCLSLIAAAVLGCPGTGPEASQAPGSASGAAARQAPPNIPASLLADLADQPTVSIDDAAAITAAYGEVLKSTPQKGQQVFDTSSLPEPKSRVRAALFRMLEAAENEEQKNFMRAALKLLAYFQDGVDGTAAIDTIAPDGRPFREIVEAEVSATAFELARRGHGGAAG